jgi:hypothetical protein
MVSLVVFLAVEAALLFLPAFAGNGLVFGGILGLGALWWLLVLRRRLHVGEAGPCYAQDHPDKAPRSWTADPMTPSRRER